MVSQNRSNWFGAQPTRLIVCVCGCEIREYDEYTTIGTCTRHRLDGDLAAAMRDLLAERLKA